MVRLRILMDCIVIQSTSPAFNADGTLSGSVNFGNGFSGFFANGTDTAWSARFDSDGCSCTCFANGYWVQVDEPFSGAMLGTAALLVLAILGWLRKRTPNAVSGARTYRASTTRPCPAPNSVRIRAGSLLENSPLRWEVAGAIPARSTIMPLRHTGFILFESLQRPCVDDDADRAQYREVSGCRLLS